MRLSWQSALLATLLAVGLVAFAGTPARTADDKKPADKADAKVPVAGNWKVTVLFGGVVENSSCLLKIDDKDGKVSLQDSTPDVKDLAKLEKDSKVTDKAVHFV